MRIILCLFILILLSGCGKPLLTYDYKDAVLIKKSHLHQDLGSLSQATKNKITNQRRLLKSGSITQQQFSEEKRKIKNYQHGQIKLLQQEFVNYKEKNKRN